MKKSLMLVGMLLGAANVSATGSVVLPSREVLSERLREKKFGYLIESTNLVADLACQKKGVVGVVEAVQTAIYEYGRFLKQPALLVLMHQRKIELVEAILWGHPQEISEARMFLALSCSKL